MTHLSRPVLYPWIGTVSKPVSFDGFCLRQPSEIIARVYVKKALLDIKHDCIVCKHLQPNRMTLPVLF